jgi:hypothetical protein
MPGPKTTSLVVSSLTLTLAGLGSGLWWFSCGSSTSQPERSDAPSVTSPLQQSGAPSTLTSPELEQLARLRETAGRLDETVWAKELQAQRHEGVFVKLWDDLRKNSDRFAVLKGFRFESLTLGELTESETIEDGVELSRLSGPGKTISYQEYQSLLDGLRDQGVRIVQTEWHHAAFDAAHDEASRSTFSVLIHASDSDGTHRYQVEGKLKVLWKSSADGSASPEIETLEATDVTVKERTGPAVFQEGMVERFSTAAVEYPGSLIAYDLNGDGRSEIILPSLNRIYWNRGGGKFDEGDLFSHPPSFAVNAVLGDFSGDGAVDLLLTNDVPEEKDLRLLLYRGDAKGGFPFEAMDPLTTPLAEVQGACAFAVGDVDGDGDLDVWMGQYKQPYIGGQMPSPYFDANDGLPSYLLLNKGDGRFIDATESAGLAKKRFRRTYANSFFDLDDDGDLDLIVVSDFAGVDAYLNDGRGRFSDVTNTAVDEKTNFGMALAIADFNLDSELDFFVTGMSSTTARRLEHMELGRKEMAAVDQMRMKMGYGNRMYIREGPGRYRQPRFNDQVARSGWSWGTVAFDFDNDADSDIYVNNGHISGESATDYCSIFWRCDLYTGNSKEDRPTAAFYETNLQKLGAISWNGYEKNKLFMNRTGRGFTEVGFLMDTALEADCRHLVVDDFDLDGRADLLLIERGTGGQTLRLLLNRFPGQNNWIGLRLQEAPGYQAPGAKVTVAYPGGRQSSAFVTGDSFMSQHSLLKHFGLGEADRVDYVEWRWSNGDVARIENPEINQYHDILPPARKGVRSTLGFWPAIASGGSALLAAVAGLVLWDRRSLRKSRPV